MIRFVQNVPMYKRDLPNNKKLSEFQRRYNGGLENLRSSASELGR